MTNIPLLQIFLSSPSDVLPEREVAERVIARVSDTWKTHVRLKAERWERKHYEASKSFQQAIGGMAQRDLVIGILWKRIGTRLPPDQFLRPNSTPYESGTVFEIETALTSREERGKPDVYIFMKTEKVEFPAASVKEDVRQYEALNKWWDNTILDKDGYFRRSFQKFEKVDEFEHSLTLLLENYLRDKKLIPVGPAWDVETKQSPYPGLMPYNAVYQEVFFGRSLAVDSALDDIKIGAARDTPVLFVVGPSGSGKSSLVRAGLVPHFVDTQIAGVDFWRHLLLEPAPDPVRALAIKLYAPDALPELENSPQPTPESFSKLIAESPSGAASAIKWALEQAARAEGSKIGAGRKPVGRLLLTLDQLETVLDSPQQAVIARLTRALVETECTWVLATLRSDRYADLQLNPDFVELRRRCALYDLPPPGQAEISDIIKGPARAADLVFQERNGQSLDKVIGAAVTGADALPLLQMTLKRLFDARSGKVLTFKAYEDMGELGGAIAAHANEVFESVSQAGRHTLDGLLRSLVADIDENGRLTIQTLKRSAVAGDAASAELIDKMTEERLLVSDDGNIRVAHEALLRRWDLAKDSPALQPEAIRLRRQIERQVQTWRRTGLDQDLLQSGTSLAAADEIMRKYPGAFPPEVDDYVRRSAAYAKSQSDAKARRVRLLMYTASGIATVLLVLAVLIFNLYRDANGNLVLALLTKADQLLVEEKPTKALVVAGSTNRESWFRGMLEAFGLHANDDEAVRTRTIAAISAPASSAPLRQIKNEAGVLAVAFSKDASRFAYGLMNSSIYVIPVDGSGPGVHLSGHTDRIRSLAFSPDGKWLVSGSSDYTIRMWNLETREVRVLCGHEGWVNSVAFDPMGRYVLSASNDGRVIAWDARTFEQIKTIDRHASWALSVDFSPDGTLAASSGNDGTLLIRKTSDWSPLPPISTGRTDLLGISFSADGKRIATASIQGPLDVWSIDADAAGIAVSAPADKRWRIKFSPDGRLLAASSWEGTVRFWNAKTLQYLGTIDGNDHWVTDLAFASGSSMLVTAGASGIVRLWDLKSIRPMFFTMRDDNRETLFGRYSPDGTKFVAGGRSRRARLYSLEPTGSLREKCNLDVEHHDWVQAGLFSPDSRTVITIGTGDHRRDNAIWISDAESCKVVAKLDVGRAHVQSVVHHPFKQQIIWATWSGEIWLADLDSNTQTKLPFRHDGPIFQIDIADDGKLLVSAGRDRFVRVWDLETQAMQHELAGHSQRVTTVAFSPKLKLIASGGPDDHIFIWDLTRPKGRELNTTLLVRGGSNRLAFNSNGDTLAVGSDKRYVAMWSTKDWQKIFQLNTLVGVRSVFDFHPQRNDLAFDGENGLIRILTDRAGTDTRYSNPSVILKAMEVFFDQLPNNVPPDIKTIPNGPQSCVSKMQ
jgi:WD40 repeat protein